MDAATILRRLRRSLLISRAELARLAQVSQSTIGRIEKGTLDPTWGTLSRILVSAGFHIRGENIVPSGDVSALVSARIVLDRALATTGEDAPGGDTPGRVILEAVLTDGEAELAEEDALLTDEEEGVRTAPTGMRASADVLGRQPVGGCSAAVTTVSVDAWLRRWHGAGWVTSDSAIGGLLSMARVAGIIAAFAHRDTARLTVGEKGSWREMALTLGELDVDYAVSGLVERAVASRIAADLVPTGAASPAIYVRDPSAVAARAGWENAAPADGVHLIAAEGLELEGTVVDDGIRLTSPTQTLLSALAEPGTESGLTGASLSGSAASSLHFLLLAHSRDPTVMDR